MKLNILIPMAGKNTFNVTNNNAFPKVLTDVNGKLLIERSSESFTTLPYNKKIIVAVPKNQISDYKLDKVLPLLDDTIEICAINDETQGAVCSAMLAIEHLDLDEILIISSFEQVLDLDLAPFIDKFISEEVDAGVLTFESIHPKWSFVKRDDNGVVSQAAEKYPISKHAIAGFYFFKNARIFIESAKNMIRNDVKYNELFYISHTLNEVILNKGKVLALPIDKSQYFHINDEHSLEHYSEQLNVVNSNVNQSIYSRTLDYIQAFDGRSISCVAEFFSDEFILNDPSVNIKGKSKVLAYISDLFEANVSLQFKSNNILVDRQRSVVEFELTLGDAVLIGTDVILWDNDNKMISMNAYLHEKNNG